MNRIPRLGWVLILLASFAVASAGSPVTIQIDGNLADGGDCPSVGVWDPTFSRCLIDSLVLNSGDVFQTIDAGLQLNHFENHGGSLQTDGTVNVDGTFLNEGMITIDAGTQFVIWGAIGSLEENHGRIEINGAFHAFNTFANAADGVIELSSTGQFGNDVYGGFHNFGTILNAGSWTNVYDMINEVSGRFVIQGSAGLWNDAQSTLINHGRLDHIGTGWIGGVAWTFDNRGVFNNHGALGTCDSDTQLPMFNSGTVNNFNDIAICSAWNNSGVINNAGMIRDSTSIPGGNIVNGGSLYNCGSVTAPLTGNPLIIADDTDTDGYCDPRDCAPADASAWATTDGARDLRLEPDAVLAGVTNLQWAAPMFPGSSGLVYDLLSSAGATDFDLSATCIESDDGADLSASDSIALPTGEIRYYLVRAQNVCGDSLGARSDGTPRIGIGCD